MKILVDADACPVKNIILDLAKEFQVPVWMFVDTSHMIHDDYSRVFTVDKASDSVDFALANQTEKGDIAVTQDYGLATMLLAKQAIVLHQNGFIYDDQNIDRLLFERHIGKKLRKNGKRSSHIKARTSENDDAFMHCLRRVLENWSLTP